MRAKLNYSLLVLFATGQNPRINRHSVSPIFAVTSWRQFEANFEIFRQSVINYL